MSMMKTGMILISKMKIMCAQAKKYQYTKAIY